MEHLEPLNAASPEITHDGYMPEHERAYYRTRLRYQTFTEIRELFERLEKEEGLTQKKIAERLGTSPSLISRRLNGQANLTLDTLCDLARAMGARLETKAVLLKEIPVLRPEQVRTVQDHMGMARWIQKDGKLHYEIATGPLPAKHTASCSIDYSPETSSFFQPTSAHQRAFESCVNASHPPQTQMVLG